MKTQPKRRKEKKNNATNNAQAWNYVIGVLVCRELHGHSGCTV